MEIEITIQEPISENTITNENNSPLNNLAKPQKILSDEDINTIIINVLDDIGDYLTKNTEFEHMRDEIINKRMMVIMKEKFSAKMVVSILKFIEFLEKDESFQEYIIENGKITYDILLVDDISKYIYDNLYDKIDYVSDMAQGWLNWNNRKGTFCNNSNFDNDIQHFLVQKLVKYVFQQYGDGYEFSNSKDEQKQNSDENANTDTSHQNESDEDNSDADNSDEVDSDEDDLKLRNKNECIIT